MLCTSCTRCSSRSLGLWVRWCSSASASAAPRSPSYQRCHGTGAAQPVTTRRRSRCQAMGSVSSPPARKSGKQRARRRPTQPNWQPGHQARTPRSCPETWGIPELQQHRHEQRGWLALRCHLRFSSGSKHLRSKWNLPPAGKDFTLPKAPAPEAKETPSLHFCSPRFTTSPSHAASDVSGVPVCGSTMGIVVSSPSCSSHEAQEPGLQPLEQSPSHSTSQELPGKHRWSILAGDCCSDRKEKGSGACEKHLILLPTGIAVPRQLLSGDRYLQMPLRCNEEALSLKN